MDIHRILVENTFIGQNRPYGDGDYDLGMNVPTVNLNRRNFGKPSEILKKRQKQGYMQLNPKKEK